MQKFFPVVDLLSSRRVPLHELPRALAWIRSRDPALKTMIVERISPFEPSTPIRREGLRRTDKQEYTGACDQVGPFLE